ncbi:RING-H2 finger protein ATL40 [Sesamum alatum]|uniref:RING-type E3 ubiquitin transferase n=1 Tax=Sesamum alatum TaxID=300844 RepID=A0AAE1XZ30_9LAMI|nr:RING-H2 finger protein ATL40 [Sesamum alatum]
MYTPDACCAAARLLPSAAALASSRTWLHTVEPPKTGLDPSIMAALPVFMFKQTINDMGSMECSVCLSILVDGEMARTLPNCKHTFHADCIDKWFGSNSTCPVCRAEAEPRLVAEPREGVAGAPPSAPPLEGPADGDGTQSSSSNKKLVAQAPD